MTTYIDLKGTSGTSTGINSGLTYISESNSSETNLDAGNSYTFTGTAEITDHPDLMLNLYADQVTEIQVQFSQDGTNWDSTITKVGSATFNEFTTAVKGKRYVRLVVTTDSLTTTTFRAQLQFGTFRQGNLPLNASISPDSDASVTRTIGSEMEIATGRIGGYSKTNKLGKNEDIDTGTVPEDIWDGGGEYTGFPTGSPETLSIVSTSASDTGTFSWVGLKSSTSTAFEVESVTLTGTTPVTSTSSWYRVHSAWYNSGTDTGFNVGDVTVNHSTTTANVFLKMLVGRSQTNTCAFTIPQGKTGYLFRETSQIRKGTSATADGAYWFRSAGGSPRLRRPFTVGQTAPLNRDIKGGFKLSAGTDIIPRILEVSTNNINITFGMDIILIDD